MFFKKSRELNANRFWKTMVVDGVRTKGNRTFRYLESQCDLKIFVEKLRDYNLYAVSVGTNPGALKVCAIAGDLKSAINFAKQELWKVNDPLEHDAYHKH